MAVGRTRRGAAPRSRRGGGTPSWASSSTGRRRRCPGGRRSTTRSASSWPRAPRTPSPPRPTPSGTRTRCGSPTARWPPTTGPPTRAGPTTPSREDFRAGLEQWDPTGLGPPLPRHRRPLRGAGGQAPRRVLPVALGGAQPAPHRVGHRARRGGRAGRGGAGRGAALRPLLLGRARLDLRGPPHRPASATCSPPSPAAPTRPTPRPRSASSSTATGPSVLWNDIMWPTGLGRLPDLVAHYRRAVPDGVVNDRFMPRWPGWPVLSRGAGPAGHRPGVPSQPRPRARASSRPARRSTTPAAPSTSSCTDIDQEAWECVRGMDRSFGYNRASDEEHFLDPRRAGLVGRRHRRQGGQPAAQRRPARRGRPDPRAPDPPPGLAGRGGGPGPRRHRRHADPGSRPARPSTATTSGSWTDAGAVVVAVPGRRARRRPGPRRAGGRPATTVEPLSGGTAEVAADPGGLRLRWDGAGEGPMALFRLPGATARGAPAEAVVPFWSVSVPLRAPWLTRTAPPAPPDRPARWACPSGHAG